MEEDRFPIPEASIEPGKEKLLLSPQFLDHHGKDYLMSILQCILPMALWRTWTMAVGFPHTLGYSCYLTAAEIAKRAGISRGEIEEDLRQLEARKLLQLSVKRRLFWRDGRYLSSRPALVKDFRGLYELVYEYHLWCHSPEYIPPEQDFLHLITADRELLRKLIRFENYRRPLLCPKPGRDLRRLPSQDSYSDP